MKQAMTVGEKQDALRRLTMIAAYAKDAVVQLARRETVVDIGEHKGHDESSLDRIAQGAILEALHRFFPDFTGTLLLESSSYERLGSAKRGRFTLTVDEIDGTTNLKRALASPFVYPVPAAISLALGTSDRLGDIEVSVVFALDANEAYAAIRVDGDYVAFRNRELLYPADIVEMRGDSNPRILVPGYSFKDRLFKARIEEALMAKGLKRVYEGCRSSAMDIIGVIRNLNDAYVDVRALLGDEQRFGAMLQGYDVAGVIPIALGAGLRVMAIRPDRPWQEHHNTDRLALVVSRPAIAEQVITTLRELPELTGILATPGGA